MPSVRFLLITLAFLAACAAPAAPLAAPTPTADLRSLNVRLTYPTAATELENGQNVRFLVAVNDGAGRPAGAAQVSVEVRDADGQAIATLAAAPYTEDVYRTDSWVVPRRAAAGQWRAEARVTSPAGQSTATGAFQVKLAKSEVLLNKYGFWLDAPTLRGISPFVAAERGDARNGLIRWGGTLAAGHVLPANWIDLHWRTGDYALTDALAVRRFMLEELGDLAFTAIRELGPFERIQFKRWPAWKVGARAHTRQDLMEWVVFYAPEDGRTFALGATVVQPPEGIDAHAKLRDSFDVFPELRAAGTAPWPLAELDPAPALVSPPLAADFEGLERPVVLEWKPARPLEADEYYQVSVDYDYKETNTPVKYATRETRFVLPEELYRTPNCRVFNWKVTAMRQTGVDARGRLEGVPVSYDSLYWYVRWFYPPGEPASFPLACPNALF